MPLAALLGSGFRPRLCALSEPPYADVRTVVWQDNPLPIGALTGPDLVFLQTDLRLGGVNGTVCGAGKGLPTTT